jgi:hypothetical protein
MTHLIETHKQTGKSAHAIYVGGMCRVSRSRRICDLAENFLKICSKQIREDKNGDFLQRGKLSILA